MTTTRTHAPVLLGKLFELGYVFGTWDRPGLRILDRKNQDGNIDLRVAIASEDWIPQTVSIYKFCGTKAESILWEGSLGADMPLDAVLALIAAL